jgi:hypothetical protein
LPHQALASGQKVAQSFSNLALSLAFFFRSRLLLQKPLLLRPKIIHLLFEAPDSGGL